MLWDFYGSLQKAVKCYVITIERLRFAGLRLSMGAVEDNQFAPGSEVTRQEAQIILQQYVQATTPVEHMM